MSPAAVYPWPITVTAAPRQLSDEDLRVPDIRMSHSENPSVPPGTQPFQPAEVSPGSTRLWSPHHHRLSWDQEATTVINHCYEPLHTTMKYYELSLISMWPIFDDQHALMISVINAPASMHINYEPLSATINQYALWYPLSCTIDNHWPSTVINHWR